MTDWLAKLPTTNTRIAATIVLAFGTGIKYWASAAWEPSWEWLSFLVVMSGLDVTQFVQKRRTTWKPNGGDVSPGA